jgi:BirA family transcriptional regulator, biotin operon repressor / biotin---[acetyl-CoA-carboxylase] ligase
LNIEQQDITPELVVRDLKTRFIGQKVIYYPVLDSTMNAARKEAQWGAEAGSIIIADVQTAGRGRMQRSWISPRGGLTFSLILRPNFDYLPYIVMLAALAVTYGIQKITGLQPQIKWPNDVLINDKKVCGILIENDIHKNALRYTVVGIGVNVNVHVPDFAEIAPIATSLSDETGKEVSRLDILRQILIETDRLYQSLPHSDVILEQWKARLITLGQRVRIIVGDEVRQGKAESVTGNGSLMIRQKDGSLIKVSVGDVNLY